MSDLHVCAIVIHRGSSSILRGGGIHMDSKNMIWWSAEWNFIVIHY